MRNGSKFMLCTGICLLALFSCRASNATQNKQELHEGFTATTKLSLELEDDSSNRFEWWNNHGWYGLDGLVKISFGQGQQAHNKIMLYGDRTSPLNPGESDWQMDPYPGLMYFDLLQTEGTYAFPFGPRCDPPPGEHNWSQTYLYTACINLDGGGSTSASDTFIVTDFN
ncbi:MAG: hypothetical protein ACYDBB_13615 [Armatimonadota bacterium]